MPSDDESESEPEPEASADDGGGAAAGAAAGAGAGAGACALAVDVAALNTTPEQSPTMIFDFMVLTLGASACPSDAKDSGRLVRPPLSRIQAARQLRSDPAAWPSLRRRR
jgi:hypothetical protein